MIIDYIINCPSVTLAENLSQEVQAIIKNLGAEWTGFIMPGTQEADGRKLVHCRLNQLVPKMAMENLFAVHELDWQIFSIRSAYMENGDYLVEYIESKASFLPFINPVYETATDTMRPVTLDDDIYLSTYAGTEPFNKFGEGRLFNE